jgi:hypothetical protein
MHAALPTPPTVGADTMPPASATGTPRRLSIPVHLALLCASLALPILAFLGLILWQFAGAERARLEHEALDMAQQRVLVV